MRGEPWLARYSFSFIPYPGALPNAGERASTSKITIFADPDGSLPHARREGEVIVSHFPQATLLVHAEVTPSRFSSSLHGEGIVHFAGHIEQNEQEPWSSHLRFGREQQLSLAEVGLARSRADLVVLSGCDSAQTVAVRPSYWFGLSEVLLAAGARRVIGSRRPLVDEAAQHLIGQFYAELTQQRPAEALRRAALSARQAGNRDWDNLVLFGGR